MQQYIIRFFANRQVGGGELLGAPVMVTDKMIISPECQLMVIESAKDVWKNTFKNDFSMLYEYFINLRKSNNLIMEGSVYKNIISGYERFMDDFIDLDDLDDI